MNNKALKFNLSGKLAFFKKPDVNAKVYFTYNNIHKVALLGLLGAIIGLKGYRNNEMFGEGKDLYPEFYEKLQHLKVSIVPNSERGYFSKKVQYFNNSVGYASSEEGGNLMVFEQWLENPHWTIYLLNNGGDKGEVDKSLWDKLCDYLLTGKCIYVPYLGKNDFPACITKSSQAVLEESRGSFINSLFPGELSNLNDDLTINDDNAFIFTEYSPMGLIKPKNIYRFERVIYTNCKVNNIPPNTYSYQDKNLCFY